MNILVFDDEPAVCSMVYDWCDSKGYSCAVATTLEAAKEMSEIVVFDCVLIDIYIDGKPKGIYFAEQYKKNHPGTIVVIITAYNVSQSDVSFADMVFRKPFSLTDIEHVLLGEGTIVCRDSDEESQELDMCKVHSVQINNLEASIKTIGKEVKSVKKCIIGYMDEKTGERVPGLAEKLETKIELLSKIVTGQKQVKLAWLNQYGSFFIGLSAIVAAIIALLK